MLHYNEEQVVAEPELPSTEQLIASAAQFLIDGNEEDAASVLLACELTLDFYDGGYSGSNYVYGREAVLTGPRAAYDILRKMNHPITQAIENALNALMPSNTWVHHISARASLVALASDWQTELLEIARGKGVHNQSLADTAAKVVVWNGLRFRSESERRIAAALDHAGVMYLPNCRARLGVPDDRLNREPDFLVCQNGKWGILEVDGEPFHPPSRTVQDHKRDRLFKQHGIRVVEHFDATECYKAPQVVVTRFLDILKQS